MDYNTFLQNKQKKHIDSGFNVKESDLNSSLFDFQKFIVKRALKKGKYAMFCDTGLGKTIMQLSWANQVSKHTNKPVLILAPLAVSGQTIKEAKKFDLYCEKLKSDVFGFGVFITNYEQLDNVDCSQFSGIVLDESSILKNFSGAMRNKIIETFESTEFKLCCTATPSPNDPMELGNHSQFLNAMTYNEMLAMYFVHDSNNTAKWRIKKHAIQKFYDWVSTWSMMLSKPSDIGFEDDKYNLPPSNINENKIVTLNNFENGLFNETAVNSTDFNRELRSTKVQRLAKVKEIIESDLSKNYIVWIKQNEEGDYLKSILNGHDYREVRGSDLPEKKEKNLLEFADNKFKILITKTKIAQFGLNYQNCNNQIFASLDFSFESTYQAMRRSWRFGQTKEVNIELITTDTMQNIPKIIRQKEKQFKTMQEKMTKAVNRNLKNKVKQEREQLPDVKTDLYHLMHGDCVQRIKEIPDNSIDLSVFSPPFADLYTYSNYVEDMGNVKDYNEFVEQFKFLALELKRVIKPGRIIAVHCMDLPTQKGKDGYIGIRRFSSTIADIFEEVDMFLHSEFTVWKDPLLAAVRTKTIGLAHKQITKDMSVNRCGIPDKVLCFKTKEENETPIQLTDIRFTSYIPMHEHDKFPKSIQGFNEFWGYNADSKYSKEDQYSHHVWQRYASPVWLDVDQTNTLRWMSAKGQNDEKHICPLQLDVIERIILLYSNEGETILSPFGGIGSEGYQALKMNRKSISIELKESYYNVNIENHQNAVLGKSQTNLLDFCS